MNTEKVGTKKYKLSIENAQAELDKLLDYYEIDFDDLPADSKDAISAVLRKVVKFIRQGRLEIKIEDGIKCIQTLRDNSYSITYKELNGKAKAAMGSKKETDQNGRIHALLGSLSDGETVITKLKGPDLSLAECLGGIFLLV